jgi:hypothetical protein
MVVSVSLRLSTTRLGCYLEEFARDIKSTLILLASRAINKKDSLNGCNLRLSGSHEH